MKLNALALSSLLISAPVLSLAAPAANAQNFTPNAGGIHGLCDSSSGYKHTKFFGIGKKVGGSRRDCRAARDWASREGERNRNHDRNSQFIGIGGNLITGLILNSQQQQQQREAQPANSSSLKAELALMKQQQEIEQLKMQLQAQQAAQYGAPVSTQRTTTVYRYQAPRPAYNVAPTPYAY